MFLRTSKKEITVGVNGLWLNKDMSAGYSKVSSTYNNQPLHGDSTTSDFRVAAVEVYSFSEPSKKVYDLHSY